MTYTEHEKVRAATWKARTSTLPIAAKLAAGYVHQDGTTSATQYDYCLPAAYAERSLLGAVRGPALALFDELSIPWHAGVGDGPSNHLLSSQVQCVNAMMAMVDDPARVVRAFGDLLGIEEVLQVEPGRYLTFEYIGPTDYFGEVPNGQRVRGAHCTSIDAAFLHRALDGAVELVLVEWKYTESYRLRRPDPAKDKVRERRYGRAVADPEGPVRGDLLPFDLLLDEPIYQLVRQQLLAHALEQDHAEGADRVRVLHVLHPGNEKYQQSLHRPEQLALGRTVGEVWQRLLRRTDRFTSVDPRLFLDQEVTSREYLLRYAEDVIHDEVDLLEAFDLERADDLEDVLYADHEFDGDVRITDEGVELFVGRDSIGWTYPFTATELRDLADEQSLAETIEDVDELTCPRCGHSPLLRVMYGMPAGPPPSDVILGGCIVLPDPPRHGCPSCNWMGFPDGPPDRSRSASDGAE